MSKRKTASFSYIMRPENVEAVKQYIESLEKPTRAWADESKDKYLWGRYIQGVEVNLLSIRAMNNYGGVSSAELDHLMAEVCDPGYAEVTPSSGPTSRLKALGMIEQDEGRWFISSIVNSDGAMVARQCNSDLEFVKKLREHFQKLKRSAA